VYTPRKDNSRANALSRRLDIAGTKEIIKNLILKFNEDGSLGLSHTINNLTTIVIELEVPEEL
jgi:hypothetical protein